MFLTILVIPSLKLKHNCSTKYLNRCVYTYSSIPRYIIYDNCGTGIQIKTYPIILMGERREMVMRRSGRRGGCARRPLVQIRIIRLIHNLCAAHSPHSTHDRHIYNFKDWIRVDVCTKQYKFRSRMFELKIIINNAKYIV